MNMKMSLFKVVLFAVFGISALIGIFVFATYSGKGGSADTIGTVVIWGLLPREGMDSVLNAAARENQALKGVTYVQKDRSTLPADIAVAIATGSAPDLVLATQEELHALTKFITPIPLSMLSVGTFKNAFLKEGELFTAPGGAGYYGVPFLVDPLALFSNRAILSSNGIARPPATWEALIGLVPSTTTLTPTRQITRGLIALGTYANVSNARGILSTLFLQQGIPMSSYSASSAFSVNLRGTTVSSSGQQGSSVLGFYTQFTDPTKVSYTWNTSLPNSTQMFLAGDLALYLGYVSEARYLQAANPNLSFNVSAVPQSATSREKSVYGLLYAFMIPVGAKNSAGAYQTAVLFTDPAAQASAAQSTGLAPATLSALAKEFPADPVATVAYSEALYAAGWLSPSADETDRIFSGMIGNVISGRSTLDAALENAARSLQSLLEK